MAGVQGMAAAKRRRECSAAAVARRAIGGHTLEQLDAVVLELGVTGAAKQLVSSIPHGASARVRRDSVARVRTALLKYTDSRPDFHTD